MDDITGLLMLLLLISTTSNIVSALPCDVFEYPISHYHSFNVGVNHPKYICISGIKGPSLWAIWSDVELTLKTENKQHIKYIDGKSCQEVVDLHGNKSSSWFSSFLKINWFSSRNSDGRKSVSVSPYGSNCFAFYNDGSSDFNISLEVTVHKLKLRYPFMMIAGMLIFYNAEEISRNVLFYYTSGVSIGMILSILLLVFIISRMIPKRSASYAFLLTGTSGFLFLLQHSWEQLSSQALQNNKIIIGYTMIAGLISFLYCYYRGPVTNDRGLDIMRWVLQGVGLFLVYYGIRCRQISLTFVLILVASRWISLRQTFCFIVTRKWIPYRLQSWFLKPKLISMEEYETEGREETVRALKALQEYCESPDCDTWQTVSRLKSPKRFASFISDGVHLTEEEFTQHEEASFEAAPFLTSDEDSENELAAMNLDYGE